MNNLTKLILYPLRFFFQVFLNKKISCKNFVKIGNNVKIIVESGGKLSLGRNVTLKDDTTIYIKKGASLIIGDNTNTGHHCEISVGKRVEIGSDVIMGAYTYVTDSNHVYKQLNIPFRLQGMSMSEVSIGSNVWIGRGAMVLKGSRIGDNSVVGASSVTTGEFQANMVIGGIPAKVIKYLDKNDTEQ